MIPISKAIDIIKRQTGLVGAEQVELIDSVGRVLAENIFADTDLPPFHRSQMDGYAVRSSDTANTPAHLELVGESAAGSGWHHQLKKGQAVRIMTGAPVPKGADAVQKMELAIETNTSVSIREPVKSGQFIVPKGFEVAKGAMVLSRGEIINANNIAKLAAFGYSKVKVAQRPKVAILATGSEIVAIDKTPGRDQIRNSNSVMLKALCEQAGAVTNILPTAGDDPKKLKAQISKAARYQMLIITGGVSVGKYDLTKAALHELGAEIFFERVCLRPGKPTVFAKLGETLVFGLPGNPVSAAVTFYLFVRIAIMQMQRAAQTQLDEGFAVLASDAKAAKARDTYLPATLSTNKKGVLIAKPLQWHGSSDLIGFARAQCLVFVPKGKSLDRGKVGKLLFLR